MHQFVHRNTGFLSNSDLSGDVEICCGGETMIVPGDALVSFIADFVRREKIAALENVEALVVLGLAER